MHRPQFWLGRLAVVAAMTIAAASLSGCGRKGSLDLPPTASITPPTTPGASPGPSLGEQSDSPTHSFEPAAPASQTPPPPPARRNRFLLDFLLN